MKGIFDYKYLIKLWSLHGSTLMKEETGLNKESPRLTLWFTNIIDDPTQGVQHHLVPMVTHVVHR